jgi:hypothetical protein
VAAEVEPTKLLKSELRKKRKERRGKGGGREKKLHPSSLGTTACGGEKP